MSRKPPWILRIPARKPSEGRLRARRQRETACRSAGWALEEREEDQKRTERLDFGELFRDIVATIKGLAEANRISADTRITASTISCSKITWVSRMSTRMRWLCYRKEPGTWILFSTTDRILLHCFFNNTIRFYLIHPIFFSYILIRVSSISSPTWVTLHYFSQSPHQSPV